MYAKWLFILRYYKFKHRGLIDFANESNPILDTLIELKICHLIDKKFLSLIHTLDLDLLIGTKMQTEYITVVRGRAVC